MFGVRRKINSAEGPCPSAGRRAGSLRSGAALWVLTIAAVFALVSCTTADLDIDEEHAGKWDCPECKGQSNSSLAIFEFLGYNPTVIEAGTPKSAKQARADMEAGKEETEDLNSAQRARAEMEAEKAERNADGYIRGEFLASVEDAKAADVILDVGSHYGTIHIKGAIPLYWEELLDENNNPKSAEEMAEIFGNAGISPEDSVVIYGDCEPCDDISVAPFVFWAMRYLGHDSVQVLDGGLDAWTSAGQPTERVENARPAVTYTPRVRSGLMADYEGVSSGDLQLVDARVLRDFSADKIAGAIHIDYSEVLTGGRMKGGDDLDRAFSGLDEERPVVVYSYAGARAAMVWLALQLMGYESSVYSFNDWEARRPPVKVILVSSRADPNPAPPGPVKIFATFDVVPDEADSMPEFSEAEGSDEVTTTETVVEVVSEDGGIDDIGPAENLSIETNGSIVSGAEIEDIISNATSMEKPTAKTMGCVACFDPILLYASGSNPSEITSGVKLGSIGGSALAPITAAGALIQDSEGRVMATIELVPTLTDEYLGTWDATGAPAGAYNVTLAAATGGKTSYFEDVLTIEIDGSAPAPTAPTPPAATDGIRKLGKY